MYPDIKVCEKIFFKCSCLYNMLEEDMNMKRTDTCVGRGVPLGKDGIYLNGQTIPLNVNKSNLYLAKKFGKHQKALATHLCIHREKGPIDD